jgi:hypothetical protein
VYLKLCARRNVLIPTTEGSLTAAAITVGESRVAKSIVDQLIREHPTAGVARTHRIAQEDRIPFHISYLLVSSGATQSYADDKSMRSDLNHRLPPWLSRQPATADQNHSSDRSSGGLRIGRINKILIGFAIERRPAGTKLRFTIWRGGEKSKFHYCVGAEAVLLQQRRQQRQRKSPTLIGRKRLQELPIGAVKGSIRGAINPHNRRAIAGNARNELHDYHEKHTGGWPIHAI